MLHVLRRHAVMLAVGMAAALGCVRLGFWQLSRLAERRAFNREVSARLDRAPVAPEALPNDTAARRFRAVRLEGAFDYDREIALTSRTRKGAPGVHVFTPLRRAGNDTAILVNRGWVYAADGVVADLTRMREADTATVLGFAERFIASDRPIASSANPRAVHRLDLEQLRTRFPYPIAPFVVVWTDSVVGPPASAPRRLGAPELTEGSHLSYALQWFSFAIIGVAGMVAFIRRSR